MDFGGSRWILVGSDLVVGGTFLIYNGPFWGYNGSISVMRGLNYDWGLEAEETTSLQSVTDIFIIVDSCFGQRFESLWLKGST